MDPQAHSGGHPQKLALTRVEAATALGVSPATIDRLTARGLLRPSRALRRPLYAVSEIERFLRETTAHLPEGGAL
jgi:predicted urease superfamily metal-dependent hydrolase